MSKELLFENRVVVITGAGTGIGRAHALLFADRGATVLVNDVGTDPSGSGADRSVAAQVVDEIESRGGRARANYHSVVDGAKIIESAVEEFGRVDVVVNNAGILRDRSFHKMSSEEWNSIYQVHVLGSYNVTRAAWPYLRNQEYGRVIFTSSYSATYGNFGQANYGMAKLGVHGLSLALAVEGRTKNIHVNTISPIAGTRLAATVTDEALMKQLDPSAISPLVAYLCHEKCTETGGLFEVGAGWIGKLRWQRSAGASFDSTAGHTPEEVKERWSDVLDFSDPSYPTSTSEAFESLHNNLLKSDPV